MWTYKAPLRDMRFVIEEVLQAPAAWAQTPAFEDLDGDTSRQILEEGGWPALACDPAYGGQGRTKTEVDPMTDDGASWLITGSKIWISGGVRTRAGSGCG